VREKCDLDAVVQLELLQQPEWTQRTGLTTFALVPERGRVIAAKVIAALALALGGVAFGLVFMNSALAIVLYYLLPTVWTILGETIHALDKPANWLDLSRTTEHLVDGSLSGTQWAQLGTSVGLWVGLVLLIGLFRLRRIELK
jgi:ABC-2 type transport system permease protein